LNTVLRFEPAARPGEITRTLHVVTDLGEDGDIDFQVSARVLP
jgi:hypothetical protein